MMPPGDRPNILVYIIHYSSQNMAVKTEVVLAYHS